MLSSRCSFGLIAVGVLLTCAPAARSDAWVSCKRDASTGQLLWLRGKSTELLADGKDPVRYLGPTLRLNVYEQDPYR